LSAPNLRTCERSAASRSGECRPTDGRARRTGRLQGYFRLSLGLSLGLFGAAIVVSRLVAGWLRWVAVTAGVVSVALGIDVGYSGLDSGFADVFGLVFVLAVLTFAVGLTVAGRRQDELIEPHAT
jgi:hypothetical protein